MTDYQQVLEAIFEHVDYSRSRQFPYNASTYSLDRMRALCALLDNPQDQYPSLHIAGSKGKGSTSAMAAAVLQAAGFRTGMYTSPHLHSLRERMRVDGALISQQQLADLWDEIKPSVKALEHTTTFEIITALAFLHLARPPVDWAVLEVGLGGRLDATNVVHPKACAITPLSYEHTDLLGHTLSLIAFEKAGIIKPGAPVIVGPQTDEAMSVIHEVASDAGAEVQSVDAHDGDWRWQIQSIDQTGSILDVQGPDVRYRDLHVPLVGHHQAGNATVAVALIHTLRRYGVMIAEDTLREGLAQTYWPGRLERLSQDPLILVDSAHNGHSAENLRAAIDLFPHRRLILLFGASADKDIHGMLQVLGPLSAAVVVTRSFHPRASSPAELTSLAAEIIPATPIYQTEDALPGLELALELAEPGDLILVTGSIFVVAAVRESWKILQPQAFGSDDWVHAAEPIDGGFTPMLPAPGQRAAMDGLTTV